MFCPKCGIENPENVRFCRSCGTDLGNVSAVLTGKSAVLPYKVDPRKRGVSWEIAITKTFTGLALLIVALILGRSGALGAANWWFWLLIPGFGALSSGLAQMFQLKKIEKIEAGFSTSDAPNAISSPKNKNALPPAQSDYLAPPKQSIYETDDLILQPSVTESTTRHLQMDSEGETQSLPNKP